MRVAGSVALVTGANRGLGRAFVRALLDAGAAKVYAAARDPATVDRTDPRLHPVRLDVTNPAEVAAVASACGDVSVLVNNAGILKMSPALADGGVDALRAELEVNVLGLLSTSQAFAPVLGRNGGGALVNMLSVVAWFTSPFNATYCATKHAADAITTATRIQLRGQGTLVMGVYAGFIDTEMVAGLDVPKVGAADVAAAAVAGLEAGKERVMADERTQRTWDSVRRDPAEMEAAMQAMWESRRA